MHIKGYDKIQSCLTTRVRELRVMSLWGWIVVRTRNYVLMVVCVEIELARVRIWNREKERERLIELATLESWGFEWFGGVVLGNF